MSDYLLTWNPNKWPLDEMQQQVEEWRTDDGLVRRWSRGVTKSIVQGDRVFLLRQGQEPRGLVGVGHCVSAVYREAHWDDDTRDANYVDVAWDFIDTEPLVSRSTLDSEEFISVHWNTQSSGIEIPSDVADKMGSLFTERITEDIETTRKRSSRHFGEIEGYSEGSLFADRRELSAAGVHRPTQAGISGSGSEGADSIVLSGGYEDDEDFGDMVIYTGHGGQDPRTKAQVGDQQFHIGNKGLAISCDRGFPVRVVRGADLHSPFAPEESRWLVFGWGILERGRKVRASGPPKGRVSPERDRVSTLRTIRDTSVGRWVKVLYEYRCQVCDLAVAIPTGSYAEAAHVRPLGQPHNGPDVPGNVLCLCPNHHVQFDKGALSITDDLKLLGVDGELSVAPGHEIAPEHARYHRECLYLPHQPDPGQTP